MKILLTFLALISLQLNAQTWIPVPDANFQNYLTTHYPASAFMTSGGNFFVDSDHADIQGTMNLNISSLGIASIEGINAFENLQFLECQNNSLVSLPNNIPDTLFLLNCSNNQLTTLPNLPSHLEVLNCNNNHLTSLPAIPSNFNNLECAHNLLTQLPVIPTTLSSLDCSYNQLTSASLTGLPLTLSALICHNNSISLLPNPLPDSLVYLKCEYNQLTYLPNLPDGLTGLFCGNNQLASLPNLPLGLLFLSCEINQITELPNLPANLVSLTCGVNQIDSLPSLPLSLTTLMVNTNQLTTIPPLPNGLIEFFCHENNLTFLPNLPNSLYSFTCSHNMITELPPLPDSLSILNCQHNQLHCFEPFSLNISYIILDNNPFTCLPNYIPAMDQTLLSYPLCHENDPVNNPNGCSGATGIEGMVFYDVNNDCIPTVGTLTYIPMSVYDSTGNLIITSASLANGNYYFSVVPGSYQLEIDTFNLTPSLDVTCPVGNSSSAVVPYTDTVVSGGDFGLNCAGFDLGVQSIVPNGWVFPGQTHALSILAGDITAQYNMHCASGISGEVTVAVTGPGIITFGGSPTSVSANAAVYSIADFGVLNVNEFVASVVTNVNAVSGQEFCVTVSVATNAPGELNITNNLYSYCYEVVNSYDPNVKETYPEIVQPGYVDEFTYTIHFQNTGSAPAFNIRLADTLDTNLDLATFKVVNASDAFTTTLNPVSRLLTVSFPNIMLPDNASDPNGSIGFIQYRVKPVAGLTDGTIIENTAYIYFDFNSPIVTNTSENLFSETAGIEEIVENTVQLYPNPSDNQVFVRSENSIEQLALYDLNGTLVKDLVPNTKQTILDISTLKSGVYIAVVHTNQSVVTKRLIVR